jgi:26S proteasome regulatory subunit T5
LRSEKLRISHEIESAKARIKDNKEKIKLNRQLPYLVSNVIEIMESQAEEEEDGANVDLDAQRKGKSAVIKTSTRQV